MKHDQKNILTVLPPTRFQLNAYLELCVLCPNFFHTYRSFSARTLTSTKEAAHVFLLFEKTSRHSRT